RHGSDSDLMIKVLNRAINDERAYRLYKKLTAGQDAPEVRSAVDRYQSALLMPAWLIREVQGRYDFTRWDDLYALKDEAQVSISNLVVRLQRLRVCSKRGELRIMEYETPTISDGHHRHPLGRVGARDPRAPARRPTPQDRSARGP